MILGGILAAAMCAATGCSVATRLERQRAAAHLSQLTRAERQAQRQDYRPQVVRLQRDSNTFFLAPVDNAARRRAGHVAADRAGDGRGEGPLGA